MALGSRKSRSTRKYCALIIGNPVLAITVLRHDLTAGLFAPVELIVIEEGQDQSSLTYVRPSSLMVVETNEPLLAAAKELDAKLHGRFVALNCAAMPSALLGSELFDHERGAFTGASTQFTGRFQCADRGTLFLDEIGNLPLELQPKLLRVLQEQEFERLGSTRTVHVDVRVIAATNQDLGRMVQNGKFRADLYYKFRADLYYRLNVFPIRMPPLRERQDDILLLTRHFVRLFAQRMGKQIDHIPDGVIETLKRYHWPGNIRELQNFIERSVVRTSCEVLNPPLAELEIRQDGESSLHFQTLADAERAHVATTLRETNWVVGGREGATSRLGLPRTTLISRMRKLGISRETSCTFAAQARSVKRPQAAPPGVYEWRLAVPYRPWRDRRFPAPPRGCSGATFTSLVPGGGCAGMPVNQRNKEIFND